MEPFANIRVRSVGSMAPITAVGNWLGHHLRLGWLDRQAGREDD